MVDGIDLSINIPWKIIEMDYEKKPNDVEQEANTMAKPPKILSFHEKMKRLFLH